MRDDDMKRLFDSATSNFRSSDITPEEIREIVDKSINYQENGNVKPVISAPKKKNKFGFITNVAAGAAAFAVTAAAIGISLHENAGKTVSLLENTDIAQITAALSANNTAEAYITGSVDLINGTRVNYFSDGSCQFHIGTWKNNNYDIGGFYDFVTLSEDGSLKCSAFDFPDNDMSNEQGYIKMLQSDKSTQYVVLNKDTATGDYGYVIIFRTNENNSWGITGLTTKSAPFPGFDDCILTPREADMKSGWLDNAIKTIKEDYGETGIDFSERCFLIKQPYTFW